MIKAIRIHSPGGPEVMKWEDVPRPEPGPGEALIKQEAVGLNYIDVYFRSRPLQGADHAADHRPGGRRHGARRRPGRDHGKAGRPRRLCRRAGRLCHRAGDRRRPAGEAAGRDRLQDRGGDDAAGHDGAVSDPPHASGEVRRNDRRARRRRRRGADPVPMGEAPGRHRDRRRLDRAEGGTRPRAWRGAHRGRGTAIWWPR